MKQSGEEFLERNGVSEIKLGFHFPKCTSVPHLHMHLLGMPFKNKRLETKKFGKSFAEVSNAVVKLMNKE